MIEYTVKVYADGTREWWFNGGFHREDGPAIEWVDGTREWWFNGKPHREDGPAYEGADGTKEWYVSGRLHREGGPAIERADGTKAWYINGKKVTEQDVINLKAPCNGREVVVDGVTYKLQKV